jgi:hypothetical protein
MGVHTDVFVNNWDGTDKPMVVETCNEWQWGSNSNNVMLHLRLGDYQLTIHASRPEGLMQLGQDIFAAVGHRRMLPERKEEDGS